jgi:iron complex transport system ATP-binding protein
MTDRNRTEPHPSSTSIEPAEASAILEVTDVSVVRGSTTILDQLSVSISLGQHTALLGPNGSGKSTLLKLLMRRIYPSFVDSKQGSVRIFGESEWNVWDLRTRLGFVSSEVDQHFLSGRSGKLTAELAVLTGFFSSELEPDPEHITASMREAATDALERMQMTHLARRPLAHMSTGERRRILLARAIVHRPEALVLDEPTSGLDLRAQYQLLDDLHRIAQSGTTLILVTHHMHEILPCIKRTVLLEKGRVAFDGPTSQAMESRLLSQVFGCALRSVQTPNGYWQVNLEAV